MQSVLSSITLLYCTGNCIYMCVIQHCQCSVQGLYVGWVIAGGGQGQQLVDSFDINCVLNTLLYGLVGNMARVVLRNTVYNTQLS